MTAQATTNNSYRPKSPYFKSGCGDNNDKLHGQFNLTNAEFLYSQLSSGDNQESLIEDEEMTQEKLIDTTLEN